MSRRTFVRLDCTYVLHTITVFLLYQRVFEVKHIVAQHGAKLTLESEQSKGTEIRVEFSEALKQHELETAKQRQEAHAERSENGSSD